MFDFSISLSCCSFQVPFLIEQKFSEKLILDGKINLDSSKQKLWTQFWVSSFIQQVFFEHLPEHLTSTSWTWWFFKCLGSTGICTHHYRLSRSPRWLFGSLLNKICKYWLTGILVNLKKKKKKLKFTLYFQFTSFFIN